jgi:hypothetical protein
MIQIFSIVNESKQKKVEQKLMIKTISTQKFVYCVFLFMFVLQACTGDETSKIEGEFTIHESYKHNNSFINQLSNGRLTVEMNYGLYGLYLPELVISQQEKIIGSIEIPRSSFKENGTLEIAGHEIDQNFDIKAKKYRDIIQSWYKKETGSCTYSGYCYALGTSVDANGSVQTAYKWGYHINCPGSRWEKRYYEQYYEGFSFQLYYAKTNTKIASFIGKSDKISTSYSIEDYGVCN